jgi:predicted MFS family arabinose efflux permease
MTRGADDRVRRLAQTMPDEWGLLLAAFGAAYGIGLLTLLALPFLIGAAMSSLSIDAAEAGLLGTVEFVGVMLASMAVSPFIGTINRRRTAYIGAATALCANAASVWFDSYEMLIVLRPIAGLGAGLVMACGNATVSNAKNPERFAAHMSVLCVVLMVAVMLIFSRLSTSSGLAGIYAACAVIVGLMCALLHKLPEHAEHVAHEFETAHDEGGHLLKWPGLLMLAAFFVFSLRDTMAWAFLERIGSEVGYDADAIGNLLSLQAIVGIFGPIIASVIGSKFGLKTPVSIGILVSGLATYIVSQSADSKWAYTGFVMLMPGTYFFTLSYLTALAAELDEKGRIVAASGSALMGGIALGPVLGGALIVMKGDYEWIGWATLACIAMTYLCVWLPLRKVHRAG